MTRAPDYDPSPIQHGTRAERTRALLEAFDAERKGYAFNDSGDGTRYATWMADLLDEWLAGPFAFGGGGDYAADDGREADSRRQ